MAGSQGCKAAMLALLAVGCDDRMAHSAPRPETLAEVASAPANPPPPSSNPEARPETSSGASAATLPDSASPVLRIERGGALEPASSANRFLHVGDSMVPLVGNYLRAAVHARGGHYDIISKPSSSTLSWANDHGLRDAMYRFSPQVVLISLGSNELFDPDPEHRARSIRQIVEEARGRPCLWIGPPAWKHDKGFLKVLRENVAPCRYFDSTTLDLPRMSDGRHPSWTGGYAWATAVWKALGGTDAIPDGDVRPKP